MEHPFEDVAVGLHPIAPDNPWSQGKSFGKILAYLVADVAVVEIPVDELDASNSGELKHDITSIVEANNKLVIDLSRLRFVDSSGLGALLSCLRQLTAKGGLIAGWRLRRRGLAGRCLRGCAQMDGSQQRGGDQHGDGQRAGEGEDKFFGQR